MEKLAIQRLVRGDDGLTKVVYIDLVTLQSISDLTNYRIVNSGDLYEEPVQTVDDPETPSVLRGGGQLPPKSDSDPSVPGGYSKSPVSLSPNQNTGLIPSANPGQVTAPNTIRSPESRVPAAVSPPAAVEPKAPAPADLGPLGGIRTAQGSILPGLDLGRFNPISKSFPEQEATSMSGNINPSQLERDLQNRRELENIKDQSLGTGYRPETSIGFNAVRPEAPATGLPSARPSSMVATRPQGIATGLPAARMETNVVSRPDTPIGSLPAAPGTVAPRSMVNDIIGSIGSNLKNSVPGGGYISVDQHLDNVDNRRESLMAQKDQSLGIGRAVGIKTSPTLRTKDDALAESIAAGTPTTIAGRPERTGSLPAARPSISNPNMASLTKDDWAGPSGTTKVSDSVFDTPSKSISGASRSVAGKTIDVAKAPASVTERTSGFVSAANNPNRSKTTSFVDAAGFSQVDRTGNRGWRNNNPGNIEASNWTKSQPGYIGTDGRFAAFDSYENGVKAQAALLGTSAYANKTIAGAIARYAPAFENNTAAYAKAVADAIGVPVGTKMSDLTPSQRVTMVNAMHEVEGSTVTGKSSVSLTAKGINARDNYTGFGLGADTPSERNAANRSSSGIGFGQGGFRGSGADSIGRNDSAGAGRGSSIGGPGIGRAGSTSNVGKGSSSGGGTGVGKGASGGVSGASRSTAGKGGASPSAASGAQSGASRSTAGKTSSGSKSNPSTSGNMGSGAGTTSGKGPGIGSA